MTRISKQLTRHSAATRRLAAALAATLAMASCSMMTEDRSDCPTCDNVLRVTLRYDYNVQRADMFADQAQTVTVYVVDAEQDRVVDLQTVSNDATARPLATPGFAFNFSDLPAGSYRLVATANAAAQLPFETRTLTVGDAAASLRFRVPRTSAANATADVPAQQLDTLWNVLRPTTVTLDGTSTVEATVPLMRLTNNLNVLVSRTDTPTENAHGRYDVRVIDANGLIGADNALADGDGTLVYHPYDEWTTEGYVSQDGLIAANGQELAEQTAHFELSLARLVNHEDAQRNPRLQIIDREDGTTVVDIDLCYYLARARHAFETRNYSVQEFLDRENQYQLSFELAGKKWQAMTLRINVMSWALRIVNESI